MFQQLGEEGLGDGQVIVIASFLVGDVLQRMLLVVMDGVWDFGKGGWVGGNNIVVCSLVGGLKEHPYRSVSAVFLTLEGEPAMSTGTRSWAGGVGGVTVSGCFDGHGGGRRACRQPPPW